MRRRVVLLPRPQVPSRNGRKGSVYGLVLALFFAALGASFFMLQLQKPAELRGIPVVMILLWLAGFLLKKKVTT